MTNKETTKLLYKGNPEMVRENIMALAKEYPTMGDFMAEESANNRKQINDWHEEEASVGII